MSGIANTEFAKICSRLKVAHEAVSYPEAIADNRRAAYTVVPPFDKDHFEAIRKTLSPSIDIHIQLSIDRVLVPAITTISFPLKVEDAKFEDL